MLFSQHRKRGKTAVIVRICMRLQLTAVGEDVGIAKHQGE